MRRSRETHGSEIDAEIFLQDESDGAAEARHAAFTGGTVALILQKDFGVYF
jgi:hypothetical protein